MKNCPKSLRYIEIVEICISMLDTRSLSANASTCASLVTRHVVVGGSKRRFKKGNRLLFGISEHLDNGVVNEAIQKLLHFPDEMANPSHPKFRNIILVGHGLRSDLLVLRKLYEEISTIFATLDTTYIAKEVLGLNFRLGQLLQLLHCPNTNLHIAGNDANFTLRALLLLAYYGLRPSASSPEALCRLTYLKALALETLPNTTERNMLSLALKARCGDSDLDVLDTGFGLLFDEG